MFRYFDPMYYMFMLPAIIFVMYAQGMVSSRYKKYSKIPNSRGITGAQVALNILAKNGITDVDVESFSGKLSDHYDPGKRTVFLSEGVYNSSSVAAIGIAAHEVGHAIQHSTRYSPLVFRNSIVSICNIGSSLSIPMLMLGFFLNFPILVNVALILFSLSTLFQLITLPVEFNASKRALINIREAGAFSESDVNGAKKVLSAAAMTYVAALAQSVLMLLYYILRFSGKSRR